MTGDDGASEIVEPGMTAGSRAMPATSLPCASGPPPILVRSAGAYGGVLEHRWRTAGTEAGPGTDAASPPATQQAPSGDLYWWS